MWDLQTLARLNDEAEKRELERKKLWLNRNARKDAETAATPAIPPVPVHK